MGTSERPDGSLLMVLAAGLAAVVLGVVWWIGCLDENTNSWIVVSAAFLLITVFMWCRKCRANWEDVRGVAAIVVVVAAVLVLATSVARPFDSWLWLQVLLLVVLVVLALVLVASEWSRVGLLVAAAVLAVLLLTLVVRVGYRAEEATSVKVPLSSATKEVDKLADTATANAAAENEKARASFSKAVAALGLVLKNAPDQFVERGSALETALRDDPIDKTVVKETLRALLREGVPPRFSVQVLELRDAAVAAVAAVPGTAKSPPSREPFDLAVAAVTCLRDHSKCADPELSLSEALHRLKVELAAYRSAVSPADEALQASAKEVAAQDPAPLEISLWEAAQAGPPKIIKSIGQKDALAVVPGPVGWLVLGVLSLLILRTLLRINAAQMPGPVTIGDAGDDDLKGVLRVALLKNLKTPAAAPGSAITQSITDLSSLAGPQATVIGKIVAAISNAIAPAPGYTVDVDVVAVGKSMAAATLAAASSAADSQPVPTDDAEKARVLVRISSASTKQSVGSAVFERDSPRDAMQSAGLWAAGFLLRRSTRVPSWASWNEGTAEALDAANAEEPSLAELDQAARTAPTSGWILVLYGNKLELAGRNLDAIGVYARAVAAHPRYLVARYRLAVSLGMSASNKAQAWQVAPMATRATVLRSVAQAAARLRVDQSLVAKVQTAPSAATLGPLAEELLQTIVVDTSWWRPWAAALRRSERSKDWLGWWHGGHRSSRSTRWLASSAQLVYGSTSGQRDVSNEAHRPGSSWQISYNLACFHARTSPTVALEWLETCLLRPGVEELKADWVKQDPDLRAVSTSPRFAAFCAQLDQGGTA